MFRLDVGMRTRQPDNAGNRIVRCGIGEMVLPGDIGRVDPDIRLQPRLDRRHGVNLQDRYSNRRSTIDNGMFAE